MKLDAESAGRTSVWVTLKTEKRKGPHAVKKLKCRVNVKEAETAKIPETPETPVVPETPAETEAVAATQADLNAALENKNLTSITIKTDDTVDFVIPAGEYKDVDFIVDAPNSDVHNSGVFKSITIKAIKDSTWIEKAVGNIMRVDCAKPSIVVEKGAKLDRISFVTKDADVKLAVNGSVASIDISVKMSIVISGAAEAKADVTIESGAAGTALTSSMPLAIKTSAEASIILQKNAEGSTVAVTEKSVSITVNNNTAAAVDVTKADGGKQTVSSGFLGTVTAVSSTPSVPNTPSTPNTPNTTSTPNTPSTPSTTPSAPDTPNTPSLPERLPVKASGVHSARFTITSCSALKVIEGQLEFEITLENEDGSSRVIEYETENGTWEKCSLDGIHITRDIAGEAGKFQVIVMYRMADKPDNVQGEVYAFNVGKYLEQATEELEKGGSSYTTETTEVPD